MRNFFLVAMAALSLTACRQNDSLVESDSSFNMQSSSAEYASVCNRPVQTVSGNLTTTTWNANTIYELDGVVNIPNGVTLTIPAGTYIKAKPHADGSATGVLVVQKGGKLNANGTASAPVVFTSYKLLDCNLATKAAPGDFGGVVILGDAPTNMPNTTTIEGLSGTNYQYGGTNSAHNGGSLTYVRIEFAGYELPTEVGSGNEINGLTLGGVGSGTKLDHIQVSYGKDDSFEFFGGTVNATNLISFAQDDDGFDFDHGYTGTITCALDLADINSTHSTSGGNPDSNGIELDGKNTGYIAGKPVTQPTINNLFVVGAPTSSTGSAYENGIHIRKEGVLTLNNSAVIGYPRGIYVEGANALFQSSDYSKVYVHGFTTDVSGPNTNLIPPANRLTGSVTSTFLTLIGAPQPFFNDGDVELGSRNCGGFFASWTNYSF